MKKKKEKKIRYADSRYAVTPLLVTPLRRLLTPATHRFLKRWIKIIVMVANQTEAITTILVYAGF